MLKNKMVATISVMLEGPANALDLRKDCSQVRVECKLKFDVFTFNVTYCSVKKHRFFRKAQI